MRAEPWTEAAGAPGGGQRSTWLASASGTLLLTALAVHVVEAGSLLHAFVEVDHEGGAGHPLSTGLFALAAAFGLVATVPRAWRSLRSRRLDMNVLVVVAIAGAVLLGEWSEGATVASLFAVANALEAWSGARARHAIAAPHAHHAAPCARARGRQRTLRARSSTCIPARSSSCAPAIASPWTARWSSGITAVDESALTGESVPALKRGVTASSRDR